MVIVTASGRNRVRAKVTLPKMPSEHIAATENAQAGAVMLLAREECAASASWALRTRGSRSTTMFAGPQKDNGATLNAMVPEGFSIAPIAFHIY